MKVLNANMRVNFLFCIWTVLKLDWNAQIKFVRNKINSASKICHEKIQKIN